MILPREFLLNTTMERLKEIENMEEKEFSLLLDDLSQKYYNEGESIPDEEYDELLEIYKQNFGKEYLKVGAIPRVGSSVKLPCYLGSLNKVRTEKEIHSWKSKYSPPYLLSDKIDGVSALFSGKQLHTRGNGEKGTDITHILPFLNLPTSLKKGEYVRGELVISKAIFKEKYSQEMANARNMTTGLINPLNKNINKEVLKDLCFVAYELISNTKILPSKQLQYISKLGFNLVNYKLINDINEKTLREYLEERKNTSEYDIDGIVIYSDREHDRAKENPKHAVAFKMEGECCTSTVIKVEWNASKHGYLKPRVQISPVKLCGVSINWCTGFNAKFIKENKIGKGATIKLTRSGDVIPYIKEVLSPCIGGEAELPKESYLWTTSNTDIYLPERNREVDIKKLYSFFSLLEAKYVGEAVITKLYDAGNTTVKSIINLSLDEIEQIDGFQKAGAKRVFEAISRAISSRDPIDVFVASGTLGANMGNKRIKLVFSAFPELIKQILKGELKDTEEELIKKISSIKGFKEMAKVFSRNIYLLQEFVKTHPEITYISPRKTSDEEKSILRGKNIVFSGFRDKELEEKIERMGGSVKTSVSKNTDILVVSQLYTSSEKERKAEKLGVPITVVSEFRKDYL